MSNHADDEAIAALAELTPGDLVAYLVGRMGILACDAVVDGVFPDADAAWDDAFYSLHIALHEAMVQVRPWYDNRVVDATVENFARKIASL